MPILLTIGRFILSAAVFTAASEILERLFDKDEESIADEIFSAALSAGVITKMSQKAMVDGVKVLPLPTGAMDAKGAADFLEKLVANKKGLEALNARLGGFAPLAIKLSKTLATVLTKKNVLLAGGALLAYKLILWVMWLPQLTQQFFD